MPPAHAAGTNNTVRTNEQTNPRHFVSARLFIEITSSTVESQIQVVFRENLQRVESPVMTGQRITDDIRGSQVRQDGLEHVACAVVGGERTPSGGFGHLLKHGRATRLGAGRAQV